MSETMPGSGNGALDLSQFFEVFFEEASENLERMEQLLLGIDLGAADDETLNAIFRCAHSVKGGAATFGFSELAELTHEMETLLDRLRRHELEPDAAMVDVLLEAGDALRAQLAERQQGRSAAAIDDAALRDRLRGLAEGRKAPAVADDAPRGSGGSVTAGHAPEAQPATQAATQVEATAGSPAEQPSLPKGAARILELVVGPLDSPSRPTTCSICFARSTAWARSIASTPGRRPMACGAFASSPPAATTICSTCSPSTSIGAC